MEVLIHFIFEIIKIGILSSVYSTLILLILLLLKLNIKTDWLKNLIVNNGKFWFTLCILNSIVLFCWMWTYWGSHGLGDSARIPIGFGKSIEQINGNLTFLDLKKQNGIYPIHSFAIHEHFCVGKHNNEYFIWDLLADDIVSFETQSEYELKAKELDLPKPDDFHEFWDPYQKFWGGWRFWLLP